MKVLVVLSAVVAVALAKPGYLGAARALAAAPAVAYSAAAPAVSYSAVAPAVAYSAPAVVAAAPIHGGYAAYGPANIVLGSDGIPLDTPEVASSKAAHLNAVAETRARDAIVNSAALVAAAPAIAAAPVVAAAPAIVEARAPLAAYANAYAAQSYAAHAYAAPAITAAPAVVAAPAAVAYSAVHPGYAAYGPANIVIGPGGVPLDTPEVAAGKAADAAAHLEAKVRNGVLLG